MRASILLAEKAHCRFGDKGDTGLFVLVPYNPEDYQQLVAVVTPERVGQHFGDISPALVVCRPSPQLGVLVIVVQSSLAGGVTASLAIDAHGKTRSGYLLGMQVEWESI